MSNQMPYVGMMLLLALGLVILLYGVSLNAGQSLNNLMIAGGVVLAVATGILSYLAIDGDRAHEQAH